MPHKLDKIFYFNKVFKSQIETFAALLENLNYIAWHETRFTMKNDQLQSFRWNLWNALLEKYAVETIACS